MDVSEEKEKAALLGHACIILEFDPETQSVTTKFDPREFKTWDFVLAVLDMGKRHAEQTAEIVRMQAMQQAAMQQAQANGIAQKLKLGR